MSPDLLSPRSEVVWGTLKNVVFFILNPQEMVDQGTKDVHLKTIYNARNA